MLNYDPLDPDQRRIRDARVDAWKAANPRPGRMAWWRWWILVSMWLPLEIARFLSENLLPFLRSSQPLLSQYGPWGVGVVVSTISLYYGTRLYERHPALFHFTLIIVSLVAGVITVVQLHAQTSVYLIATFILSIVVGIQSLDWLRKSKSPPIDQAN